MYPGKNGVVTIGLVVTTWDVISFQNKKKWKKKKKQVFFQNLEKQKEQDKEEKNQTCSFLVQATRTFLFLDWLKVGEGRKDY